MANNGWKFDLGIQNLKPEAYFKLQTSNFKLQSIFAA